MKTAEEILKSKLNPSIAIINNPDYTFNKVIEAMEEYANQFKHLHLHSVSGKTEVCPSCRTRNLHHMGHGAWCCAFCGNNGKPLACADTKGGQSG